MYLLLTIMYVIMNIYIYIYIYMILIHNTKKVRVIHRTLLESMTSSML